MAVSSFRDRMLLALSDPAAFGALLPADGPAIRTVLGASYDLEAVRIDQVHDVAVRELALEQPLARTDQRQGAWTQTVPSYTRTEFLFEAPNSTEPAWIDILARLRVTVVTEVDPAGAESVTSAAAGDFSTVDEFREEFPFVDVDAFMAEHGIATVQQLRERFEYSRTEVQLRTPGTFDPNDPGNRHTLDVALATVAVDPLDLAAGLRAARVIQQRSRALGGAPAPVPADNAAPYAVAVVFDAAAPAGQQLTAQAVEQLFAGAGVAALFLSTT